jgi:hypothetical protein
LYMVWCCSAYVCAKVVSETSYNGTGTGFLV